MKTQYHSKSKLVSNIKMHKILSLIVISILITTSITTTLTFKTKAENVSKKNTGCNYFEIKTTPGEDEPKYKNIALLNGSLPEKWNWNDVNGRDFIKSNQNKGNCGCCWVFAPIRCVESVMKIESDRPDWNVDLSEQEVLSCSGAGDCSGGNSAGALSYIGDGVVNESCFPYVGKMVPCSNKKPGCPVTKTSGGGDISFGNNFEERVKQALIDHGPLMIDKPGHSTLLTGWDNTMEPRCWVVGSTYVPYNEIHIEQKPIWVETGFKPNYSLVLTSSFEKTRWVEGEPYEITWNAENINGDIEIRYSIDAGESYPNLIANVSADTGSYLWKIPSNVDSTNCRIQIESIDMNRLYIPYDYSELFTILPLFSSIETILPDISYSDISWADINNDNYLDLITSGKTGTGAITKIYKNNGQDIFTEINTNIMGIYNGSIATGDINNDENLDIMISGNNGIEPTTKIYKNNGDLTFTEINTEIPGITECDIAFGYLDDDSYIDLAIAGNINGEPTTKIYKNNGDETFSEIETGLPGVYHCCLSWGDYNNDRYSDLAIAGKNNSGPVTKIYKNNGNKTFTPVDVNLKGVYDCYITWADYDKDDDLDLTITGKTDDREPKSKILQIKQKGIIARVIEFIKKILKFLFGDDEENNYCQVTKLYQNNGNGDFVDIDASFTGISKGSITWTDINNDQLLDLFISGTNGKNVVIRMYQNKNDNIFECSYSKTLSQSSYCVDWADYDNDIDPDFAISRSSNNNMIYRCNIYE